MQIDRRSFLAGTAATLAAVAAPPAFAVPTTGDIRSARLAAVRICEEMEEGMGHRAIRRFAALSCWHFDPTTYPGYRLIRHHASGLTFIIEEDADLRLYARRIFLPTDPPNPTQARHLLTGVAARRVAIRIWPVNRNTPFPFYLLAHDLDLSCGHERVAEPGEEVPESV